MIGQRKAFPLTRYIFPGQLLTPSVTFLALTDAGDTLPKAIACVQAGEPQLQELSGVALYFGLVSCTGAGKSKGVAQKSALQNQLSHLNPTLWLSSSDVRASCTWHNALT